MMENQYWNQCMGTGMGGFNTMGGGYYQPQYGYMNNPYGMQYSPAQSSIELKNLLDSSEENELKNRNKAFSFFVDNVDMLASQCLHKNERGYAFTVPIGPDGNPMEDVVQCRICGQQFLVKEYSEEEVQEIVGSLINLLHNLKIRLSLNKFPIDAIREYLKVSALIAKIPQLYKVVQNMVNMDIGTLNGFNSFGQPNSFAMLNDMGLNTPMWQTPVGFNQFAQQPYQPQPQMQTNMGMGQQNPIGYTPNMNWNPNLVQQQPVMNNMVGNPVNMGQQQPQQFPWGVQQQQSYVPQQQVMNTVNVPAGANPIGTGVPVQQPVVQQAQVTQQQEPQLKTDKTFNC